MIASWYFKSLYTRDTLPMSGTWLPKLPCHLRKRDVLLYLFQLGWFLLPPPPIIFISWSLIPLQYCTGFCHTLTWISHGVTCVPHPEPPSHFLPHPIPLGHRGAPALVSCIQPGLAICFTLDNIYVSMLLSQVIPPSPSSIESKSLFYTSMSLFLSCI